MTHYIIITVVSNKLAFDYAISCISPPRNLNISRPRRILSFPEVGFDEHFRTVSVTYLSLAGLNTLDK